MTNEQRKQLTKNLGYRTLYEINYSSTILTATLVGTVLLTQYGRGIRFEELLKKVKWLRKVNFIFQFSFFFFFFFFLNFFKFSIFIRKS